MIQREHEEKYKKVDDEDEKVEETGEMGDKIEPLSDSIHISSCVLPSLFCPGVFSLE